MLFQGPFTPQSIRHEAAPGIVDGDQEIVHGSGAELYSRATNLANNVQMGLDRGQYLDRLWVTRALSDLWRARDEFGLAPDDPDLTNNLRGTMSNLVDSTHGSDVRTQGPFGPEQIDPGVTTGMIGDSGNILLPNAAFAYSGATNYANRASQKMQQGGYLGKDQESIQRAINRLWQARDAFGREPGNPMLMQQMQQAMWDLQRAEDVVAPSEPNDDPGFPPPCSSSSS